MKMLQLVKKTRFAVVYPVLALVLIYAKTSEATMLLGGIFVTLGEYVRIWANGFVGHNKVNRTNKNEGQAPVGNLITAGPYSHIRHPLYFGTLLIMGGTCVATGMTFASPLILTLFILIYRKKIDQEEELISGEIGPRYEDYRKAVPKLYPSLKSYPVKYGTWSWHGIQASKEWKTLIWIAVLFIFLYLREEFYQEHEFFNEPGEIPKHVLFICAMFSLITLDLLMVARKKWKFKLSKVSS